MLGKLRSQRAIKVALLVVRPYHLLLALFSQWLCQRMGGGRSAEGREAVIVLGVYRRRNSRFVQNILAEIPETSYVALWSLDGVAAGLDQHTVGCGPGGRTQLLNRCLMSVNADVDLPIMVIDDDVSFRSGGVSEFLRRAIEGGFDVAQPAHWPRSRHSYPFLTVLPLSIARKTTFVEIGPVVWFSPGARTTLWPLAEETPMGWGIDLGWSSRSHEEEICLGVVDAAPIVHWGRTASQYNTTQEEQKVAAELSSAGRRRVTDLQSTVGRWWIWQSSAPWLRRGLE